MNRVKHYRLARRLSQEKLGEKVHMTQHRIWQFEHDYPPWPYEARALADYFGVRPERLFPGGFKTAIDFNNGAETRKPEKPYVPDPEPAPTIIGYHRICPKCGAVAVGPQCVACGKELAIEVGPQEVGA